VAPYDDNDDDDDGGDEVTRYKLQAFVCFSFFFSGNVC